METVRSVLDMLRPHATALAVGAACATGLYALSLPRPYYDFNKVCGQFDATNLSQDPYFFDKTQYEWVPMVEAGWRTVREELETFLQRKELIPYFGENLMTRKQCWKVLGLKFWGLNHTEHQSHFPRTMELLNKVPGLSLVAFSQIEAGSAITPHNGDTNANIRCHLGLVVPGELPEIGFRVGTEEHSWREGELLMFCDAHRHTAFNYTDKTRIILQFDVIRPEYKRVETLASARVLASICTQKIMLHTLPFIRGRKWALRLVYYSLIPFLFIPIWTPFLNQWLFDFFTDKAKAPDRKPEESA